MKNNKYLTMKEKKELALEGKMFQYVLVNLKRMHLAMKKAL